MPPEGSTDVLKKADEVFEKGGVSDSLARLDANDMLYAVESSTSTGQARTWNAFAFPAPGDQLC